MYEDQMTVTSVSDMIPGYLSVYLRVYIYIYTHMIFMDRTLGISRCFFFLGVSGHLEL
jgi:hypothetical protein